MAEFRNNGHDVTENTESKISKNEVNETNEKTKQAALNEIEDDLKPKNSSEIKEQKDIGDVKERAKELTKEDYEDARDTAKKRPEGLGNFTDHTEAHVEQVANKSSEAADSIENSIDKGTLIDEEKYKKNKEDPNRVNFEGGVDKNTLEAAAISHDTGMKEGGFVLDKEGNIVKDESGNAKRAETSDEIRKNHSLNSAVNLLEKREEYEKMGVDADEAAALCMAHSKSNSGIKDLNSKEDWSKCFDRIDSAVEEYNKDKPDEQKISFDRAKFENDENKLGQLSTSTFALRLGDVSRDSGDDAVSQGGGDIHVDKSTVNSEAKDASEEVKNADVRNSETGTVDNEKSKIAHIGEQNICENHTTTDENGELVHEITVADGDYAPNSTFEAIKEHAGECETASDENMEIDVKFNGEVSEKTQEKYNEMRENYYDTSSNPVTINYPWDNE